MNKEPHIIEQTATIREALGRLNSLSGGKMTLFVVRDVDNPIVVGTLTDGDVRRAILRGVSLDDTVQCAMFTDFRSLHVDIPGDEVDTYRRMRADGIRLVPRIDAEGRLIEMVDLDCFHTHLPLTAILMAGGQGERLRPMTLKCPKPLLKIEGKAIIDYNIEVLAACGINDITVTTRYLAEMIHDHFARPVAGVTVRCVTEDQPLGTIGAAALVPRRDSGATLVMNSDLLTTVSFEDMYLRHRDTKADITVAVIPYQISVPYAILSVDGDSVTGIEEKPAYSYYANAGIYIFDNSILDTLSPDTHTDATDLIEHSIEAGRRVVYYIITGTWIDIGTPTDFRQATELMRHHRNLGERR